MHVFENLVVFNIGEAVPCCRPSKYTPDVELGHSPASKIHYYSNKFHWRACELGFDLKLFSRLWTWLERIFMTWDLIWKNLLDLGLASKFLFQTSGSIQTRSLNETCNCYILALDKLRKLTALVVVVTYNNYYSYNCFNDNDDDDAVVIAMKMPQTYYYYYYNIVSTT